MIVKSNLEIFLMLNFTEHIEKKFHEDFGDQEIYFGGLTLSNRRRIRMVKFHLNLVDLGVHS